jgi:hypothetical protein
MTPPAPQTQAVCAAAYTRINLVPSSGIQDSLAALSWGQR